MAETVIDLDDETVQAIEQASQLICVYQPRKAGEFTEREFSVQNDISVRQANNKLSRAVAAGSLFRRLGYHDGHIVNFYRVTE